MWSEQADLHSLKIFDSVFIRFPNARLCCLLRVRERVERHLFRNTPLTLCLLLFPSCVKQTLNYFFLWRLRMIISVRRKYETLNSLSASKSIHVPEGVREEVNICPAMHSFPHSLLLNLQLESMIRRKWNRRGKQRISLQCKDRAG